MFRPTKAPLVTAIALLLITPGRMPAQTDPSVEAGQIVRVLVEGDGGTTEIEGRVLTRDARILSVATANLGPTRGRPVVEIQWADVRRIKVAAGTKSAAGTGALIGASVLGVAGGIAGVVAHTRECSPRGFLDFSIELCGADGWVIPAGVMVGAATGALIGALIGSPIRSTRWRDVELEAIQVEPDLVAGGVTLRLTARF